VAVGSDPEEHEVESRGRAVIDLRQPTDPPGVAPSTFPDRPELARHSVDGAPLHRYLGKERAPGGAEVAARVARRHAPLVREVHFGLRPRHRGRVATGEPGEERDRRAPARDHPPEPAARRDRLARASCELFRELRARSLEVGKDPDASRYP
jgi:hypothetical protein